MKWTEKRQYDRLETGICRHLHRVRVRHILEQIQTEGQRQGRVLSILDVGCGDGVITRRVRERFAEHHIEGVDADPVRLARAKAACPSVRFREGDVAALPYAESTFDIVLCHHVMEHVPDDARVLDECRRVLAPGGLLILGIPQEDSLMGRILRRVHRKLYAEGEHVHFYTIAQMRARLLTEGFDDIAYAKFGFLYPNYYLHLLMLWNPLTFRLGHWISQRVDATADSLIFVGRKPMRVMEHAA